MTFSRNPENPIAMASRAVIIHSSEQAHAALAAATLVDRPITLYSAVGAAAYGGAAWFAAIVAAARVEFPEAQCDAVLDCGDHAGLALAALRQGWRALVLRGPPAVRNKIAAIAATQNARLDEGAVSALDLRHCLDPEAAVRTWLAQS